MNAAQAGGASRQGQDPLSPSPQGPLPSTYDLWTETWQASAQQRSPTLPTGPAPAFPSPGHDHGATTIPGRVGLFPLAAAGLRCSIGGSSDDQDDAPGERRIWMVVGERRFAVTLADNEAARAFASQLPLTLDMPDLNGNEKHQKLPKPLPTNVTRPGTIRNGDLMLWGADTLVVFLTFDSPYSYTRLGRIEDAAALPQALGR
ncbi:MAG: hypothetical protein IPJ62_14080, partial [Betaproteobacteria bacterium]|nr:hypothetical protein [Betaproteobacteria bacterium]